MKKTVSIFTLLFMIALTFFMIHKLAHKPHTAQADSVEVLRSAAEQYRQAKAIVDANTCGHAVVCGGLLSDHLAEKMNNPVVKSLYERLGKVQYTKTDRAFFAYDSYRIGNKIYWTKNPRFIPAGEPILSDGVWAVLVRCGNLIALQPQEPTLNAPEPADLYPPAPTDPAAPVITETVPPSIYAPTTFDMKPPQPPVLTPDCLSCVTFEIPIPPPVNTPEPPVGLMALCGFFALAVLWSSNNKWLGAIFLGGLVVLFAFLFMIAGF